MCIVWHLKYMWIFASAIARKETAFLFTFKFDDSVMLLAMSFKYDFYNLYKNICCVVRLGCYC